MKPADLIARQFAVRQAAARRWKEHAPAITATAARLAQGGPVAAATPERAARFVARETAKRALRFHGLGYERIIGATIDLDEVAPTLAARKAGRPVARIVELLDTNRVGEGFATGFLLGPGLLLTNWHVFGKASEAQGCGAQFGYELNEMGLLDSGVVFELDPDALFVADEALDIALVGVKKTAAIGAANLADYGRVRLIPALGKILAGQPVSIIQHPDGRHKHWAVRQNKLVLEPTDVDAFLTYTTDTLPGSSGSPAFNHDWELVAVHHSGVPRTVDGNIMTRANTVWKAGMPDTDIDWVANEGARVSKVHGYLQQLKLDSAAQQALIRALLSESIDPVLVAESLTPAPPTMSEGESRAMNVIVNGTANFYVAPDVGRSAAVLAPPVVTPVVVPQLTPGIEKKLRFDPDYDSRPGYQTDFLHGFDVPAPEAPANEALKDGAKPLVLDYHHYSLTMHKTRRLIMWAAANVDYDPNKRWRTRDEFGTDTWKPDPRILVRAQIEDLEFYEPAAKFDRGHIVRRDDVAWGETKKEEEYGNSDSFHWTNCSPQHEGFNRDAFGYQGLWGGLENHIAKQAGFVQNRLILLAGPVLDETDPSRDFGSGIKVKVPMVFWKVVTVVEDTHPHRTLRAYGFLLDQSEAIQDYGWEGRFRAGKFKEYQVSLSDITERSRVKFPDVLLAADPLKNVGPEARRRPLTKLEDVRLR